MSKRFFQFACILYIVFIIIYPQASLQGAQDGINAFINTVLPTLLPFFIGTSILVGSGVVLSSARLLSPIVSKLIGLPGASVFAFLMAAVSGYPLGAKLTNELYQQGYLGQTEAKRTMLLASISGPSFFLGAIATGLLNTPQIGWVLLLCHYLSALGIGYLSWVFYPSPKKSLQKNLLQTQPAGNLFSSAISSSITSLLSIGACMIFFSSLSCVLKESGLLSILQLPASYLLSLLGFEASLAPGLISGTFEMTSGCIEIAHASADLTSQATLCCFLVTFGGFSIFAQCLPFLKSAGIKLSTFLFYKLTQAILALFLCRLAFVFLPQSVPTFSAYPSGFTPTIGFSGSLFIFGCSAITFLGALMIFVNLLAYKKHHPKKSA